MTREIWWIFTQALKSLKISFRWPVFVQSVQGLSCKNTEKLSFMTLKKIWINPGLVVSKMASGIGWTLIRALRSLKNCTFMGFFCPNHMFQLENVSGIIVLTLKVDAKFKEKLTRGLKNDVRSLVNFLASIRKSENLYFDGLLVSKVDKI